MIWFEAEQILTYLHNLELQLDEWTLSALEMRMEKAELVRLQQQLHDQRPEDAMKEEYVAQLGGRIKTLQRALDERLRR
ncbi:MAG: hypothetical protein LLF76_02145 [Planctomycetaceae bacterium]|nr:hypothetical protein [Planctomycetaceae bacterium]